MKILILIAFFLALSSCKSKMSSGDLSSFPTKSTPRWIIDCLSKKTRNVGEPPRGLEFCEQQLVWHLSEGSEVIPFDWYINLESRDYGHMGKMFYQNLNEKFGIIEEVKEDLAWRNPLSHTLQKYPEQIRYIGLTAAWSHRKTGDGLGSNEYFYFDSMNLQNSYYGRIKNESGKKKIAMVGTNCALCHTGQIKLKRGDSFSSFHVEGAPAMADIRGFFRDMLSSLLSTALDSEKLDRFLHKFNIDDLPKDFSKRFIKSFREDLNLPGELLSTIGTSKFVTFLFGSPDEDKIRKILYEGRNVIYLYFEALLAVTYRFQSPDQVLSNIKKIKNYKIPSSKPTDLFNISPNDKYEELRKRMKFLANFVAEDPNILTTHSGFGRTDAFGRIGNKSLRNSEDIIDREKSLVHNNAPVSFPPIWSIQFTSMLQWNANTSSVLLRNIGQSLGTGSLILNFDQKSEPWVATTNIKNLGILENLSYDIPPPNWVNMFGESSVNTEMAKNGCNHFYKKNAMIDSSKHQACASCHEYSITQVSNHTTSGHGDNSKLNNYRIYGLDEIGTDPKQTINQTIEIYKDNQPSSFEDVILGATVKIKNDFLSMEELSQEELDFLLVKRVRGEYDCFSNTANGSVSCESGGKVHEYLEEVKSRSKREKLGYPARHLSGIWATAPYLHNGSIPSMMDLLTHEDERPDIFFVGTTKYNPETLGFYSGISDFDRLDIVKKETLRENCEKNPRYCFDVNYKLKSMNHSEEMLGRIKSYNGNGNSNRGHNFGVNWKQKEKRELIEFLKIYNPHSKYQWNLGNYINHQGDKCSI